MRRTLIVIANVCILQIVFAQSPIFEKTFIIGTYQDARGIIQSPDGNFMMTGLVKGSVDSMGSLYVSKMDAGGNLLWQKHYDYPKEDGGNDIILSNKGKIIVTGHTGSIFGKCDGYLMKIDQDGQIIWRKQIGELEDDVFSASVEDQEGKIYSVGRTENHGAMNMDLFLHVTDPDGHALKDFRFGTMDFDNATSVTFGDDGNLIMTGIATAINASETDALVMKCTPSGHLLWLKRFVNPGTDAARKVIPLSDGKMMVVGKKKGSDSISHAWICCLDRDGNLLWEKLLGSSGREEFFTGLKVNSGSVICIGAAPAGKDTLGDYWTVVINMDGTISQQFTAGTPLFDIAASACISHDGAMYIAGKSKLNEQDYQAFIVKSDMRNVGVKQIDARMQPSVYPNPVQMYCTFSVPGNFSDKFLMIYNVEGKMVFNTSFSKDKHIVTFSDLPKGILFYTVSNTIGEVIFKGKLLVEEIRD